MKKTEVEFPVSVAGASIQIWIAFMVCPFDGIVGGQLDDRELYRDELQFWVSLIGEDRILSKAGLEADDYARKRLLESLEACRKAVLAERAGA